MSRNLDKIMSYEPDEISMCLIEGIGLIIGRLRRKSPDEAVVYIKNPRVVEMLRDSRNAQVPPQLRLGGLVGAPEKLYLTKEPVFVYTVRDKNICNLYTQETTGITLTTTMPVKGGK
jgi:hypothetical protein